MFIYNKGNNYENENKWKIWGKYLQINHMIGVNIQNRRVMQTSQ